jgi:hypothetical protein
VFTDGEKLFERWDYDWGFHPFIDLLIQVSLAWLGIFTYTCTIALQYSDMVMVEAMNDSGTNAIMAIAGLMIIGYGIRRYDQNKWQRDLLDAISK